MQKKTFFKLYTFFSFIIILLIFLALISNKLFAIIPQLILLIFSTMLLINSKLKFIKSPHISFNQMFLLSILGMILSLILLFKVLI